LFAGRLFKDSDTPQNQSVLIVNEALAKLLGGTNALGASFSLSEDPKNHVVIGIVSDAKHLSLEDASEPHLYACSFQHAWRWGHLLIKTKDNPRNHINAFTSAVWNVEPDQSIVAIQTMEDVVKESIQDYRFTFTVLSVFAGLGLFLMLFGIYAVFNYAVSERIHELGIRIAIGAQARDIFLLLYKEGVILLFLGIGGGITLAAFSFRFLQAYLFQVPPYDPMTLGIVAFGIILAGSAALFSPALRAVRTNPITVIRS
jgi:putative ABC transport system permease protein